MKYFATLTLTLLLNCVISQENNTTFERPKTEITVGISDVKTKNDLNSILYYDYVDYPYYMQYYNPTNTTSFNLGIRRKLKNGAIRIQGKYRIANEVYFPEPDANNYSTMTKSNSKSYGTGAKIGYDFFKSYKILEVNYGADLIFNKSHLSNVSTYQSSTSVNPYTGQLIFSSEYDIEEDFSSLSYGVGLNLGLGLRISEKIKIGIESQMNFLRSDYKYFRKNKNPSSYSTEKNKGNQTKTETFPLGLIYVAFGL